MNFKITYFILGVLMASNILFVYLYVNERKVSQTQKETLKIEFKKKIINEVDKITRDLPDIDSAIIILGW
jgi:Na+/melibiose symporter-like transporter